MTDTPLRRQLLLIAVASILPLAIACAIGLALLYEQQREAEQRRTMEIARALATAVHSELKRSIAALQVMAVAIEQDGLDLGSFDELAAGTLQRQPMWRSLVLADTAGRQVAHSEFRRGTPIPANPEPGSVRRVVETGQPAVGPLMRGRGGWAFAVRAPVMKNGKVHYVVSAVITPQPILDIVTRQQVRADWVISVFDDANQRVARSRSHERYIATPGSPTLIALMAANPVEGMGMSTTLEGDAIFTAYARVPDFGWSVAMGLPETVVTAPALRSTSVYALALALSVLGGLLAAFTLARRINRSMADLREAAHVVGAGGEPRVPPTPLREAREVGEALQKAARERRAAEAGREELLAREQAARGEAEAANLAKDQFLAMLGHELRNPIAAISNAAQLADMAPEDAATQRRARDIVKRQVRQLARLTDDLLDAARAILGKIELRTQPVDLAAVAASALASLAASGRGLRHRVEAELDEAWVHGDPVRLEQVVTNLLVNAIKYTPEGRGVTVRTGVAGGEAYVTVADEGIGMAPDLVARAFELFVQGRRDIDRAQGGLGIGLTLVRRLAELHGGSAAIASAGEDRGTEVTVRIPAGQRPPPETHPAAAPAAGRSVLIIEDNDDARESLETLLALKGHQVESARDGITGLEKALALAPDLAIVDLGLPGMDGYELVRRMRASSALSGTFIVALTGYGTREARERALAAGFDEHLTKPVAPETLEALLATTAAGREPARSGSA